MDGLETMRATLPAVLRNHGVMRASVFGSFARGDERDNSDVDLLVEFEAGRSLLDLVRLRDELHEVLGREVDVATPASLHPLLRDAIMAERIEIL
jgi:uncharacterized protein